MPLPPHSLTVQGGCNCRAIRYKISIPPLTTRPLHPYSNKSISGEDVHLPMIAIDHCNDCRRATGSIIPMWFCTPINYVSCSLLLRSKASTAPTTKVPGDSDDEALRGPWLSAKEIFQPDGAVAADSFLTFFKSSEGRTRSFCGRCGTNIGYVVSPMPAGWDDMLDVVLGTVDRGDLEGENLMPERSVWGECGIEWVRRLIREGAGGVPEHGGSDVSRQV